MNRTLTALVGISLFCSVGIAQAQWPEVDPEEGRLRMGLGDGTADRYWIREDESWFKAFRCESGTWDFLGSSLPFKTEATFCWTGGLSAWLGGGSYHEIESDEFFESFDETDKASIKSRSTEGPTIDTVIGTVSTHEFDIRGDRSGGEFRQCMGFSVGWDRGFGLEGVHYGKALDFYACGVSGSSVAEPGLRRALSGFSIEGEFEALVE